MKKKIMIISIVLIGAAIGICAVKERGKWYA